MEEETGVEGVVTSDETAEDSKPKVLFLLGDAQLVLREWAEAANVRTRDAGVAAKVRQFDALRLTIIDAKPAAIIAICIRIILWVALRGHRTDAMTQVCFSYISFSIFLYFYIGVVICIYLL